MRIKAYFPHPLTDKTKTVLLKNLDPSVEMYFVDQSPTPTDYDILVNGRPTRGQLSANPNLKTLIVPWAGIPEETRVLLHQFPQISLHNLHHNAITTAETALALMLSAAKFLVPIDRKFRRHNWEPRYAPSPSIMLNEKKILILGFGKIGQHIGKVCHALGMQVIGVRRNPTMPPGLDYPAELYPIQELDRLLPQARVLMITLPLTEQTKGLIGQKELALLPKDSLLINVGRGAIVDQKALYLALKSSHLAGAGLDVWYRYPKRRLLRRFTPPANYPFHRLNNVVMSPHRAGSSTESEKLRMLHLAILLNAAAKGESIPNRVNLQEGY